MGVDSGTSLPTPKTEPPDKKSCGGKKVREMLENRRPTTTSRNTFWSCLCLDDPHPLIQLRIKFLEVGRTKRFVSEYLMSESKRNAV